MPVSHKFRQRLSANKNYSVYTAIFGKAKERFKAKN